VAHEVDRVRLDQEDHQRGVVQKLIAYASGSMISPCELCGAWVASTRRARNGHRVASTSPGFCAAAISVVPRVTNALVTRSMLASARR